MTRFAKSLVEILTPRVRDVLHGLALEENFEQPSMFIGF